MEKLREQLDGLVEKYTELLLGETDEELKEQVKMWIIYSHIAKSMPHLAKHWNGAYPDAKQEIKEVISQIKERNEAHRAANQKK
ncbi:YusU family protein [Bacillus haynesii]|uniref:YusU family protein n=1 Tax=Bacillus haynesii TaxID=1925021 RepID=UPI00227F9E83|nr:YusU family protein [Bacillus haynesii]MCY8758063.1 YusU family protein [Bacillus haynesii]